MIYATRVPAPFTLNYNLLRGAQSGRASLRFERDPQGYDLTLTGQLQGKEVLGLASRGGFDNAGLAPARLADRRRGRDRLAANFDRTLGRITYSGPQVVHELLPGAQDRLSWMVQLPAIVEADPASWRDGGQVRIQVSGVRGDAGVWTFVVQGRTDLTLPAGEVRDALHLVREPLAPYDTRVEVWLDPARRHLPARLRLTTVPGGDGLDLALAGGDEPLK